LDEKIKSVPESAKVIKPNPPNAENEKTWKNVVSTHFKGVIPTSIDKGWLMMGKQILENNNEFTDEMFVNNTKCLWNATMVSDWMAYPLSKTIDLSSKANVYRHLGDCARMWSQVRNLRLFSYENCFGPITADMIVGNTNPDGSPRDGINIPNPCPADASDILSGYVGFDISKIPAEKISKVTTASLDGKTIYVDNNGKTYTTNNDNKLIVGTNLEQPRDADAEEI
jgi:hypothetical protein